MDIEKRAHHLSERLNYIRDIFDGKHPEDIELLHNRLNEFFRRATEGIQSDPDAELTTLAELFTFMERKLETKIQPMDKVRIVRHPQRICLRDILENVYDNFTEIGGQEEHSIDPSMLIARATITRRRGKKTYNQLIMVIGQEKGHGEEFRNGGSVKPWGNSKALQYMKVAETEGIPIHTYVFTPGSFPIEDTPGAAQQIAKNLYEMAGLTVPMVAVFSEGGSGGAEAISLADRRLMLSHGYYSVISPEGAAAIEGRLKPGQRATPELIERLRERGIGWATVELEVGLDTFRVVDEDDPEKHHIHTEFYTVPQATVDAVNATHAAGGRVIAVGTTSVRSLESAWDPEADGGRGALVARDREATSLYILPGYEFHVVDALITNFHVPRSTLMMLVSAFSTRENILAAYQHAIDERYRLLSFGDAMFLH